MRGISFSAGEEHLIRFPSTKPLISVRSSKVQFTPAESSGTFWASNTNCTKMKNVAMQRCSINREKQRWTEEQQRLFHKTLKMEQQIQAFLLDRELKCSVGNTACKSPLFTWKCCFSSLCNSCRKMIQIKQGWGEKKILEVFGMGVKIKIYILMEKVPHRPWVRHWFELQSILRLRCWELPQQQQTTGLTSAVFILLFNKKWQCSVNRYTASHVGQTKRNRDPCLSILSPSRSALSHSLTSSHFNLFFPFKGRMAPGPQVLSITLGVVIVRPSCKQGCVTMNNILLRSTKSPPQTGLHLSIFTKNAL